ALSLAHGSSERALRPREARPRARRAGAARAGLYRARRPEGIRGQLSVAALRRHEAARGACPHARGRSEDAAHGRAFRRPRCADQEPDADRALRDPRRAGSGAPRAARGGDVGAPGQDQSDGRHRARSRRSAHLPLRRVRGQGGRDLGPGARRGDQGAMKYLSLLVLALIWEAVVQLGLVSRDLLPSLSDVAKAGWTLLREGDFWRNGAASLYRGSAGLALAVVIGALAGIAMAWWRAVDALVGPLVEALYPMPKSALIPVTVLWLGFGDGSKILLIFLGCMLPVTLGAYNGARSCEQALVWSARSLGASRLRVL